MIYDIVGMDSCSHITDSLLRKFKDLKTVMISVNRNLTYSVVDGPIKLSTEKESVIHKIKWVDEAKKGITLNMVGITTDIRGL